VIEDAESLNGLLYQGRRVDQHVLSHGDVLTIAPTVALHYRVS
jgi:pSer/pThr/pTyr-binding forkhead associated (FHA) protein